MPELVNVHREYLYTPEGLLKALGLTGDKVFKVTCEFGVYSLWTTAKVKDDQDV